MCVGRRLLHSIMLARRWTEAAFGAGRVCEAVGAIGRECALNNAAKTYQQSYSGASVEREDVGDVVVDVSPTWRMFTKRQPARSRINKILV